MRTAVFVGGVHGVGKTSVIEAIRAKKPGLATYDPGDLFWRYYHDEHILTTRAVEEMVTDGIKGLSELTTLINWHYAVWTKGGYTPQIGWDLWRTVVETPRLDRIILILLTAHPDLIYEQRKKDREAGTKKRKLDRDCIREELLKTDGFFTIHSALAAVSKKSFRTQVVWQENIEKSADKILAYL